MHTCSLRLRARTVGAVPRTLRPILVVAPGVTAPAPRAELLRSRAAPADSSGVGDDGATDYQAVAASLNALLAKSQQPGITGKDLRNLVMERFGRSYDIRLARLHGRMYLQVMWRFLEQKSFPLSPEEYMQQLDAVAEYLNDWGMADTARQGIMGARKPPGYTGGGNARCISIPLPVDLSGARGAEWQ